MFMLISDTSYKSNLSYFFSLVNAEWLLNTQDSFHRLLHKADGERADWEYPFAVAGVNISYTLAQTLVLQSGKVNATVFSIRLNLVLLDFLWNVVPKQVNPQGNYSLFVHFFAGNRRSRASVCFVQLLEDDEMAFDNLFCVAFQMLDAQWLARRASYMEFNVSISYTRYVPCVLMVSHSIALFNPVASVPSYQEVLKSTVVQLEQELTTEGILSVQNMPSFRMLKR
jgi:hypothetical protein